MQIVIINFSGNTGKTTLSKHLFGALLPGVKRIQIEDVNLSDDNPDFEVAAGKFKTFAVELNTAADEHYVIDIGASNAKAMINNFSTLKSTRAGIDFWIIPVAPASKQRSDSLNTAKTLMNIGVDPDIILMLMNNIVDVESIETDFDVIFKLRAHGIQVIDEVVLSNKIFDLLKNRSETVFDLLATTPDFKALMRAARDKEDLKELHDLGHRQVLQDMAEFAADNLRGVFNATPLAARLALPV